jgi:HEPN domain-containing protein
MRENSKTEGSRWLRQSQKDLEWTRHVDGFYIPTRYPNGLPAGIPADVYTKEAAEPAIKLAT